MNRYLPAVLMSSVLLSACGGGSGGNRPAPMPDLTWSAPTLLSPAIGAQSNARVTLDENNIATIGFTQNDATNARKLLVRRVGGNADTTLVLYDDTDAILDDMQRDAAGHISLLWHSNTHHTSYLRRFDAVSDTWGPRITVANDAFCDMSIHPAGDTALLCRNIHTQELSLHLYRVAGNSGSDLDSFVVDAALDGLPAAAQHAATEGDWLIVWTRIVAQGGTHTTTLHSTRLSDLTANNPAQQLLNEIVAPEDAIRLLPIAHQGSDRHVLAYVVTAHSQFEAPQFLYTQRHDSNGWHSAEAMRSTNGTPLPVFSTTVIPQLVSSADGSAHLVWSHRTSDEQPYHLVSRRLPAGSATWTPMTPIPGSDNLGLFSVQLLPYGDAGVITLWGEPRDSGAGFHVLRTSHYTPAHGWSQRGDLHTDNSKVLQPLQGATNDRGRAIIALRDITAQSAIQLIELCPASIVTVCTP